MRAELPALLTAALALAATHWALAGELCMQGNAVKVVVVDFWERPAEFQYYVVADWGGQVGRGSELALRQARGWLVIYILQPARQGGVYTESAAWRELAVVFAEGRVCASGFDECRGESGILTIVVYRDGITCRGAAVMAAAVAAMAAAAYAAVRWMRARRRGR
ncbi:MAG: hypothetical protein LM577_02840 [Thermoproteaceae archaeon]|nr:hypothetical protein [Thermoproteaceae archaeon]